MKKEYKQIGACGICCDTCGLKAKEICQGCAAGNTAEAIKKVEFLKRINALCPVLECAAKNKIGFCSRDCDKFPCKILEGEFPYGKSFLEMYKSRLQKRR
jgi:hypothetical protein